MELLFWILFGIILYTFAGYGILITILVKIKRIFNKTTTKKIPFIPSKSVTLLIAAYNEEDIIKEKLQNSIELDYPEELFEIVVVTDGSTDNTMKIVEEFSKVKLLHKDIRQGKTAAINRAMQFIKSEVIVFTDANTMLNQKAIINIVKNYEDEKVGCVAGEKRILKKAEDNAAGSGEGLYWKYESFLKKMDNELKTTIGAAGELFSIRRELFEPVDSTIILDDFIISMKCVLKGYKIAYEPNAYAIESSSLNIEEELKRKIRICAGGIQSIFLLKSLFNPFKYGIISFQFISHRVLRWTITPLALLLLLPLNILLLSNETNLYTFLLIGQILFYAMAFLGYIFQMKNIKVKILYLPLYFSMMNYSAFAGMYRYLNNSQNSIWEKAKRA